MSSLSKLTKNIENYKINEFYKQMTPEQYKQGIENAVKFREQELYEVFNKEIKKIREDANAEVAMRNAIVRQLIIVELLYEIADELECFVKEPEFLDQKIEKVKGFYENTTKTIENYTKYKRTGQALRENEKKKKKLEEMFGIEF